MKASRLFTTIICFLLVINFFRTANGAGFIGASDVLKRLDQFEFDLDPIYGLVDLWKESDHEAPFHNSVNYDASGNVLSTSDDGIMTVPSVGGSGSFGEGGFYDPGENATFIEKCVAAIGDILEQGWSTVRDILSTVSGVLASIPGLGNLINAVSDKIHFISRTIVYLWNNAISLLMLPIQLLSQTLSFSFWLLGFSA